MKSTLALQLRSFWAAFRAMVILTLFIGIVYTGAVTLIGQFAFSSQANGSTITDASGTVIGSKYIGQSFIDSKGNALPQYFQSRPSATVDASGNASPYNGGSSSASNYGLSNPALLKTIAQRKAAVAKLEHVSPSRVPADAVTASASGLDYQISPAYAAIQVNRVAKARNLSVDRVSGLVGKCTTGRGLGFIGEPGVNVVELNAALDRIH